MPDAADAGGGGDARAPLAVCLLTDRRYAKTVKTLLEERGRFGRKIEAWAGGGGGGVDGDDDVGGGGGDGDVVGSERGDGDGGGVSVSKLLIHTTLKAVHPDGDSDSTRHDDTQLALKTSLVGPTLHDHVKVIYLPTPTAGTTTSPPPPASPLHAAILSFLARHPPTSSSSSALPLPKRWTIYPPLLLLPANTPLTTDPSWKTYLHSTLPPNLLDEFYAAIVRSVGCTHLAVNAPIPPSSSSAEENIMRKPANITPLYRHSCPETPETPDFNDLWVSSTQNGIHQTWKPLYTMFSRGNVVEKMRIRGRMEAGISTDTTTATTTTTTSSTSTSPPTFFPGRSKIRDNIILDLYAGIGYFVFPYTTHSPRLVLGWEINPHSVEGLVRAAPLNSVDAVVVPEGESISKHLFEKADNSLDTRRKNKHLLDTKIVIFNESNETAIHRIREFREAFPEFFEAAAKTSLTQQPSSAPRISHINLGLLPTSRPTWALACEIIATPGLGAGADEGGWVHVHENVDVGPGVAEMGRVIVGEFEKVLEEMRERRRESGAEKEEGGGKNVVLVAECVNVFVVKTYAPGVVHCVFDVWVHPRVV